MATPRARSRANGPSRLARARDWLGGRTPDERRWPQRLKRILIVAIPIGFLSLLLFAGVAYALVRVPEPSDIATARSTLVIDRAGRHIARLHAEADRVDIPVTQVPRVMRQAVIAAEDHD